LRKKIIHQLSLSDIGGVQRSFALYYLYALKKSDFQHSIYSMHNLIENFSDLKNYHNIINNSLINKIKFLFFLFSKNYIVHFYNNLGSSSVYKLLNIIPSSNIIFHERGTVWNAKDEDFNIYRSNANKAKIIIANSNASKSMLIKRFGIDDNKIKVIYNGFLTKHDNFIPKNSERYSDRFNVGFLGRLDTPKGVHVLINAAKKLTEYDFFIAGKGILENELKELAEGHKNIIFLGSTKEPLEFISKMDLMIVPSVREPLGNTIIESGYCKKPVIASNVDGIAEIIKHGIGGILIEPDKEITISEISKNEVPMPKVVINPNTQELQKPKEIDPLKLCESIVFMASNSNIRELYGKNLHKTVKEKFNIENYYEMLEQTYKKFDKDEYID
jgi:glycosyltransferase involved in cell wall biosynthesis